MKQCVLESVQLGRGAVALSFGLSGLPGAEAPEGLLGAGACVSLRLELEISPSEKVERAAQCAGHVRLPPALAEVGGELKPGSFLAESGEGAVWSSLLPASPGPGAELVLLGARLGFPSMVRPLQLLLEELEPLAEGDLGAAGASPRCGLRCWGGTPTTDGQILQHLLPADVPYRLWVLGGSRRGGCDRFDLEARATSAPAARMQEFYLGPPAWLCEGAAWPPRLEQLAEGVPLPAPRAVAGGAAGGALRARRFALRDVLELTRPPHAEPGVDGPQLAGGLRTLELQVTDASVLRLTTDAATVPVRPLLMQGRSEQEWQQPRRPDRWPAAQVPLAGGEVRYSIHAELPPGEYTLAFVTDFAVGGLRPCASVFLRLELVPRKDLDAVSAGDGIDGECANGRGENMLDEQVKEWTSPLDSFFERAMSYQLTLPRPASHAWQPQQGVQKLARAEVDLAGGKPFLLRASVSSPFAAADIGIQVFCGSAAVGDPRPAPDGTGYVVLAGPFSAAGRYAVEVFHVPRRPFGTSSQRHCVTVSVDLAAVAAALPPLPPGGPAEPAALALASAPLLSSGPCRLGCPELPAALAATPGRPAVIDGEFLLPRGGRQDIEVAGPGSGPWVVRAEASSPDAEVSVGVGGAPAPPRGRRTEDALLVVARAPIRVTVEASRLPTPTACPLLRLHLVVVAAADVPSCPGAASDAEAARGEAHRRLHDLWEFQEAFKPQRVDTARMRYFSHWLAGAGVGATVMFRVRSATAELRFELGVQPPWLPVEVLVEDAEGVTDGLWARARPSGGRLSLLAPSLPKGLYRLHLRSWSRVWNSAQDFPLTQRCALVTGAVVFLEPSGRDASNFRQEMLNLAELLAVSPLPASLAPSWLRPQDELLASQMYAVPPSGGDTILKVDGPRTLRLVAEPADILAPRLSLEVRRDGPDGEVVAYPSALMGGTQVALSRSGTYLLRLIPSGESACPDCVHQSLPFYLTVGLSAVVATTPAAANCPSEPPLAEMRALGMAPSGLAAARSWRHVGRFRARRLPGPMLVDMYVPRPSVALIGSWSDFASRHVRVGFKTQEGVWVGEQRMGTSALEIELPPGHYTFQVEEPSWSTDTGCMDFGIIVSQAALRPSVSQTFSPQLRAGALAAAAQGPAGAAWSLSLGARCDAPGASPLPLDALSPSGGSGSLGGPLGQDGRLLLRHRVMLTNIHDGRKKVFLRPRGGSLLRVAVVSGDAGQVEVALEDGAHRPLEPSAARSHGAAGWSAAYELRPEDAGGVWLSFHREHQDAHASGCAAFELLLQAAPAEDAAAMSVCPSRSNSLQELARRAAADGSAEGVVMPFPTAVEVATFDIDVDQASIVEVEVRFNFLLSDVQVWMHDGADADEEADSDMGAAGAAAEPLNARVSLLLRLQAGHHAVRVRHRPALPADKFHSAAPCFPLRISIRRAAWSGTAVVASAPAAPVSRAGDLVLVLLSPQQAPSWSMPSVAGALPSSATAFAGGLVCTWDGPALVDMALGGLGRELRTGGGQAGTDSPHMALPVSYAGAASGEVVVLTGEGGGRPWAGGPGPELLLPARPWLLAAAAARSGATAPVGAVPAAPAAPS
ncbi:unnamed protein product, partial [Prorocentrum cordatum]